jgi:NhaP-type Na+/H+ or K+/H+ antiporter
MILETLFDPALLQSASSLIAASTEHVPLQKSPAMIIAIALGVGMLCQAIAHHVKVPGIVVLLFVGVLLGPDVFNIINPDALGPALHTVVGFAVAVVLFEGGLQLNLRHVLKEGRAIRGLVTIGAAITGILGTIVAKFVFHWPWTLASLFGSLVMVTGPTVINPLVKRIRLERRTATVLEAEGVVVDALGAVIAVVALEFALETAGAAEPAGQQIVEFSEKFGLVFLRLGVGGGVGMLGGLLLIFLLQYRNLIPEGSENVFILAQVMLIFQVSNFLEPESGVAAAIVAGTVVGNVQSHTKHDLRDFKEQLTMMFIALLFILLAADVRLADVTALGWPGVAVVAALMFLIRPLGVFLGTAGSDLTTKQKAFISWIGPRGIIAAAVASFFAVRLEARGIEGGVELRALVFLVIAVTVIVAGLSGGLVARMLGLQRPKDSGWVILGSNELARTLAHALQDNDEEVLSIDSSAIVARQARMEGLDVLVGNALEDDMMEKADIGIRRGVVGCTPNEEVNLLFARKAKALTGIRRLLVAVRTQDEGITPSMVEHEGGELLFGVCADIRSWAEQIRRGLTVKENWRFEGANSHSAISDVTSADSACLAIVLHRDGLSVPVDSSVTVEEGDLFTFVINEERRQDAEARLHEAGWVRADEAADGTTAVADKNADARGQAPIG